MFEDDHDHKPEPIPGLPDYLPEGEEILWQGSPDLGSFLRRVLHLRKIAVYFGIVLLAAVGYQLAAGTAPAAVVTNAASLVTTALLPIGLLWVIGRSMQRSAIYTITTQRVVLRFGVALPITMNVPFSRITGADARVWKDGSGDITLALEAHRGTNFAVLWPHAKPWQWLRPEPALRCVPDAADVARLLGQAWSDATGVALAPQAQTEQTTATPALEPAHR